MPREKCRLCNGTGFKEDPVRMGKRMRALRKGAGLSQTDMAHRLGISNPLVCDLELGRRNWTTKRINDYKEAMKK